MAVFWCVQAFERHDSSNTIATNELGNTRRLDAGAIIRGGDSLALESTGYTLELHIDFQRGGSDIVEAFIYNGHRETIRLGSTGAVEPCCPTNPRRGPDA
jgi:hypothetical protein